MTKKKIEYWVIPPNSDAEFVANMEEVLDVYSKPYDAECPVVCMDEQPFQLIKETRKPLPASIKNPKRVDYEYERAGTANIFMFTEPLVGWREPKVREKKTKIDWAISVSELLEGRYAGKRIVLVSDNLNTHTKGAFYEAFEPEKARQILKRITFCHTPKHGSWLNVAESELSALTRQCISKRRIGTIEELTQETYAWATDLNKSQRTVDWQMKVNDARCKLKSIYPNS